MGTDKTLEQRKVEALEDIAQELHAIRMQSINNGEKMTILYKTLEDCLSYTPAVVWKNTQEPRGVAKILNVNLGK